MKILINTVFLLIFVTTGIAQDIPNCLNGDCENGIARVKENYGIFIGNFKNGKKDGLGVLFSDDDIETTYNYYENGVKQGVQYTHKGYSEKNVTKIYQSYDDGVPIYPAVKIVIGQFQGIRAKFSQSGSWINMTKKTYKSGNREVRMKEFSYGNMALNALNNGSVIIAIEFGASGLALYSSVKGHSKYNPLLVLAKGNDFTVQVVPKKNSPYELVITDNWRIKNTSGGEWIYKKYTENGKLIYAYEYDDIIKISN